MQNYRITIAYDGSRYQGWQRQKKGDTIQARLEACLSALAEETLELIGSGRTDAGVHALGQVANFHCLAVLRPEAILDYCYAHLPPDIVVTDAEEVAPRFHARYNAQRKTYLYRIWNAPRHDVFLGKYTWHVPAPLDLACMRRAAKPLVGKQDFRSFTNLKAPEKSTVRQLFAIAIAHSGALVEIRLDADGFLYNMARILVGTLVEAGTGKLAPESFPELLAAHTRAASGPIAPPQGLFLEKVVY